MAGAHDAAIFEFTLIEFAAVVRADVFDGVDRILDITEQDIPATHGNFQGRSGSNLGFFCDRFQA